MEIRDYIGEILMVGVAVSIAGALYVGSYLYRPVEVYTKDLNNDNRPDIVVKAKLDEGRKIFLQQEDGTYKKLEDVLDEKKEASETEADKLEEEINSNL